MADKAVPGFPIEVLQSGLQCGQWHRAVRVVGEGPTKGLQRVLIVLQGGGPNKIVNPMQEQESGKIPHCHGGSVSQYSGWLSTTRTVEC
jgi:hypothetical protein